MSTHRCKEAVGRDFYVLHKLGVYCVCVFSQLQSVERYLWFQEQMNVRFYTH